jgi:hypothetical protein
MGKKIIYIVLGALFIFGLLFLLWTWLFSGAVNGTQNNGQFGTASDTNQTLGTTGNGNNGNGEIGLGQAGNGQNATNGTISLQNNSTGGTGTGSSGTGGGNTGGGNTGGSGTGGGAGTNGTGVGGTAGGSIGVQGVTWLTNSTGSSFINSTNGAGCRRKHQRIYTH